MTNKNGREPNNCDHNSDDYIESNDKFKERVFKESSLHFPTVMHKIDESNITPCEITNTAHGEGPIPVSFTLEFNWEALTFSKVYSRRKSHFNEDRKFQ